MCNANHDHEAMKKNRATWLSLKHIGNTIIPDDEDGPGYVLEMRNCACGSTLAIELPLPRR